MIYRLSVSEGWLDAAHGFTVDILEAYLPRLDIAVNLGAAEGQLWVHRPGKGGGGRYEQATIVKEIEVPDSFVVQLEVYLGLRTKIIEAAKELGLSQST